MCIVKCIFSDQIMFMVHIPFNQISFPKLLVLVSLCDFRMTMTFIVTNPALTEEKNGEKYELRF